LRGTEAPIPDFEIDNCSSPETRDGNIVRLFFDR
jgi:hypothetical protein